MVLNIVDFLRRRQLQVNMWLEVIGPYVANYHLRLGACYSTISSADSSTPKIRKTMPLVALNIYVIGCFMYRLF